MLRAREPSGAQHFLQKRRERPHTASAARAKNGAGIGGLVVVGAGGVTRAGGAGVVKHAATGESRVGAELLKLLQERVLINGGRAGDDSGGKVRPQTGGGRGSGRASWDCRLEGAGKAGAGVPGVAALEGAQEDLCVHGGKTPGGVVAGQWGGAGGLLASAAPGGTMVHASSHTRKLLQVCVSVCMYMCVCVCVCVFVRRGMQAHLKCCPPT